MNRKKNFLTKVMQRLLITAAFLAVSLTSLAQTIAVAANKMNVLYIGVDNPITVSVPEGKDDNVTITITGAEGTVIKTGAGQYNIRVSTVTDNCVLNVWANGTQIGTSTFRVRNLPYASAVVGGYQSGSKIAKDVFSSLPGVGVYVRDVVFELKYTVIGYTVKLVDATGNIMEINCEGAPFSPVAKRAIQENAKSGDIITIQNIRVKSEDNREMKLPALMYHIE